LILKQKRKKRKKRKIRRYGFTGHLVTQPSVLKALQVSRQHQTSF